MFSRKNYKLHDELIEDFLDCILNYKIKCYFKSIYFDADKSAIVVKYKEISRLVAHFLRLIQVTLYQMYYLQNQLK